MQVAYRRFALVAGLACASCAVPPQTAPLNLPSLTSMLEVRMPPRIRGATVRHLYFGDSDTGHVYQLPLINGIPSQHPSNSLAIVNVQTWGALAVGPDGSVYTGYFLLESHLIKYFVDVYAPGASGHDPPARTIEVTNIGISDLWVDQLGYLYVSGWSNNTGGAVDIFAPGASGLDSPVQIVHMPNRTDFTGGIATDSVGDLYVTSAEYHVKQIYVFANPITDPTLVRTFCTHRSAADVAVDDRGDEFVVPNEYRLPPGAIEIPVMPPDANACPMAPLRKIGIRHPVFAIVGVASWRHFLYAVIRKGQEGGTGLYTFDSRLGIQRPLGLFDAKRFGTFGWMIRTGP